MFNSIPFLLFFPTVCVLYFLIPAIHVRTRNLLLLIASYYFYMNWEPAYALLLLTSTILTYVAALGIGHFEDKGVKKAFLVCSLVLNLAILFLFKYYNFLSSNIMMAMLSCGLYLDHPEYFMDNDHLWDKGARKYSSMFAHDLKKLINNK